LANPADASRVQAERALRESERRFRLVVEAAPTAMVMIDRAGKIILVNAQAERAFEYSRGELVGRPVEMLVPARFRGHHPGMRDTFFADPRPRLAGAGRELYGLKKDGGEFPVEIGLNPIETDEGTRVLSTIVDITERKAAELALRESEQRYSLLVDGVTDYGIFMLDPNGTVTNWNRGAERIKGYRAEEIIGQHFSRFFTEEDRAANMPQHALEIAARDGRYETEALRVRKNGSRFWANAVIDAIKDGDGRLIGFAKITRDITERVNAARELEEARIAQSRLQQMEAIRLVIDTIPALVWSSLPDGTVDFTSRRWLEYTGLSSEQALGWGYTAAIHPEDFERWRSQRPARVSAGVAFEDEARMRQADGEYRHFLIRQVPLLDDSGNIVKWYGTATDIEDRKRPEELHAELTRVARLTTMGELTGSIAHEIIQPLSAIVTNGNTCLHWLEDQTMDVTKARSAATRAVRDAERASDLIRRIRALMTKSETQKAEMDLNDVVTEVLSLTHSELLRHRVSVHTALAATLPPVFGDRVQLQQLILNLIMNGIEAMASVAGRPKVLTLETRAEGADHVLVLVRDSGVGFNPEQADQIFDAFFTTKPEGTGMGLAICRSIVEAHDGHIWASPGSPQGAVFQFTLPTNDVS
jgi:PAS domain S-box-containing protein